MTGEKRDECLVMVQLACREGQAAGLQSPPHQPQTLGAALQGLPAAILALAQAPAAGQPTPSACRCFNHWAGLQLGLCARQCARWHSALQGVGAEAGVRWALNTCQSPPQPEKQPAENAARQSPAVGR